MLLPYVDKRRAGDPAGGRSSVLRGQGSLKWPLSLLGTSLYLKTRNFAECYAGAFLGARSRLQGGLRPKDARFVFVKRLGTLSVSIESHCLF